MARRKLKKDDRRFLKKAGFGREYKEMGALACALEEVKNAPYVPGYAVEVYEYEMVGNSLPPCGEGNSKAD